MKLLPAAEVAPLIHGTATRLQVLDDTTALVTLCAAAEVLRSRGMKIGVLVRALIDAANAAALEVVPLPRGRG